MHSRLPTIMPPFQIATTLIFSMQFLYVAALPTYGSKLVCTNMMAACNIQTKSTGDAL